ncbi:hypothetical protein P9314_17550 [Paenibacillus validus]|uniref:Uncharacterized protein n=1 Tax=Paenibacillus validus TaxID=44253 RepID=A0A7X2ZBD2_9BACL|nr:MULTISPECIES: hypothetical protein [Paenibacillus]MED4602475.1 hypothetical protein [Paenibacillus validus]MED4608965.1 hypothetical protein [Paenibacillus validus]MUG71689.1 hypothetical protein [Paenibacillus validus]
MSVKRILADRPHTQPESGTRAGSDVPEDHYLPPRKVVHPTEKEKWLRFFYRSLLWIFVLLVAGLLVWGWQRINA